VKSEGVIDGDTGDEGCHDVKHWTRRVFTMRMMERNKEADSRDMLCGGRKTLQNPINAGCVPRSDEDVGGRSRVTTNEE